MIFGRYGSNLQNTGKEGLKIYRPRFPDWSLVSADQKGAEALVVAYILPAGNVLRELFLCGIKTHFFVEMHIFSPQWVNEGFKYVPDLCQLRPKDLKTHKEWKEFSGILKKNEIRYFIAKKTGHSLHYRMKPPTFIDDVLKESEGEVALSLKEGQKYSEIYHNLVPELAQIWWPQIEAQVRKTGYIFNLFGFPRYAQGPYNEKTWRELTAFTPQSTVGCITAIAFCSIQNFIEENNLEWNLLGDCHDSIYLECPDDEVEIAAKILKSSLEQDLISPRNELFKMEAEVSIGKNRGKWNEDNLDGMKEL